MRKGRPCDLTTYELGPVAFLNAATGCYTYNYSPHSISQLPDNGAESRQA